MRPFFMSYIQGEDRGQAALLPAAIEDYVAADAPVRVIDAFVDGLDVRGLRFGRSVPAAIGRPPYDPRDLLKLYLYGYLNEVRSSRRLERECSRNVEVMWLLRRLAPDFKTIADFRRDNGAAIVGTCRAFVLFCRDQGLFTARLVALDGSKFRAAASAKRVMGRREIAEEAAVSTAGSPSIWPIWMRATPANPMKCQVRRQRRFRSSRCDAPSLIAWPPSLMTKIAILWWKASPMPGRWGSAKGQSRRPITYKRPSTPRLASSSTTR